MDNRIRALRTERGWTQAALADLLDVSRQTVNALETGRYDPSLPLAFRLARLLERPIEEIFVYDETSAAAR
ncbi:putative transcriptional regulator [Kineococcus radiotolerans]|uniref:Putative transcriptional regulator n=1 Tax=Kineococcus radiotolerans TaxID=131568 RepID=A0A7W4TQK9_KINRA|nr:helix-turn-helix transcriptional regulator [Kineococcus radiotolerans]MBB2902636.1 putative transcriptional regulator [Kineococcus radiotolerans]